MANNASAEKRIRQTKRRTAENKSRLSRIKSFVRKVEEAVAKGDGPAAAAALLAAQPELDRGVSKGVLHRNTVARKVSRLSRRVKTVASATL